MAVTKEKRDEYMRAHHDQMIWTRFAMVFLGFWLLATPATFGYTDQMISYSDWVCGALFIFLGFLSVPYRFAFLFWGGVIIGIWLQFAPLLFWAKDPVIYVNDTLIGIIAIAFCLFVPMRPKELERGPLIPPGWSYNPSSWQQRMIIVLLATIGWFFARYMATFQLHYTDHVWDPFFGLGTQKVITSIISQDFPVPDAGLGAMAYSLEAIMAAKGGVRRWHLMPWVVVSFGVLAVPVGFISIILIMLQPLVVGAWCGLCLMIAVCMLIILALSIDEVVAVCQYLIRTKKEGKPFWKTFFMGSEYENDEVGDKRTPTFNDSPQKNIKAMFWGMTMPMPLNLIISALLGCWLLLLNRFFTLPDLMQKSLDVLGALIVVFSIISWAEVIRSLRYANIVLALIMAIMPFVMPESATLLIAGPTLLIAAAVMICSIPRGKIKEKYGNWDKRIK